MIQPENALEAWFGPLGEATVSLKKLERLLAEAYKNPAQALIHSWETSSHLILLGSTDNPIAFMLGRFEMFDRSPACYLGPAGIAPEARGKGLQNHLFASYREHAHTAGLHPEIWWGITAHP